MRRLAMNIAEIQLKSPSSHFCNSSLRDPWLERPATASTYNHFEQITPATHSKFTSRQNVFVACSVLSRRMYIPTVTPVSPIHSQGRWISLWHLWRKIQTSAHSDWTHEETPWPDALSSMSPGVCQSLPHAWAHGDDTRHVSARSGQDHQQEALHGVRHSDQW